MNKNSQQSIPGACFCQKLRFEINPPTDFCAHCHCDSCRRSHGSAFVTWTSVPLQQFKITGGEEYLAWYASSQWVEWGFCKNCGTSLFYRAIADGHPESPKLNRMYLTVTSLLGELDRQPTVRVSCEEEPAWFHGFENLPRHRGKTDERM